MDNKRDELMDSIENALEPAFRDINELNILPSFIPKDKDWYFVSYSDFGYNPIRVSDINWDRVFEMGNMGYKPVSAFEYPQLLTGAKKAYSERFIIYKGSILCERDKPKSPEPVKSRIRKLFNSSLIKIISVILIPLKGISNIKNKLEDKYYLLRGRDEEESEYDE